MFTCLYDVVGYALLESLCLHTFYYVFMLRFTSVHVYMFGFMFYHGYVVSFYMHNFIPICLDLCCHMLVCLDHVLYMLYAIFHLSHVDTTFCLPFCLLVFFLVCLLTFLLVFFHVHLLSCLSAYLYLSCLLPYVMRAMSIMLICFMPLSYTLCTFSFHCLFAGFLSLPLHVCTCREDIWT